MVDFGACKNCGSRAVVCGCMLAKKEKAATRLVGNELPPMLSSHVAQAMRVAGWHNDTDQHARLFMAANYNSEQANGFFEEGKRARANGEHCSCKACCAGRRAARG